MIIQEVKTTIPDYIVRLVRKIEKAPDFGYDDEEVMLSEWCDENNIKWLWNDSISNAEIILTQSDKVVEEMKKIRGIE